MAPNGYLGHAAPGALDMGADARSSRGWNGGTAESRALAAAAALVEGQLAILLKLQLQRGMRVVDGGWPGGSISRAAPNHSL
eukprot:5698654-Pyramimonas_sp.AAC.1